ncbi:MAG TPA: SDR family NAD(P)-dependent oxidoreductase [Micropepsaceae bacterium]|mgnify:CR=1 FL=1|nr:SDR family NAD(P)-dependent oxidoreductase [Micropepsaceae bacterium]
MIDLKGKTAFITGGASGLGLAMARALGHEGMKIMLADLDAEGLKVAEAELQGRQIEAASVIVDVTDRSAVRNGALKTVERFGKVHVVCNNAGVAVGGPIGTVRERDWDWIIDVNIKGVVYGVETFTPLIKAHGEGGHFVNTASMAGMISPPGMEPYCASKFAVVAMSEGWAGQLAPFNIGVSALCPGYAKSRIFESGRARPASYGGPGDIDPGISVNREEAVARVLNGMDADVVGRRVVEGIKANELHIFTHREMRVVVDMRMEMLRQAFDRADASAALSVVPKIDPSELLQQLAAAKQ